jgi:GT2 family glycosyltransferase
MFPNTDKFIWCDAGAFRNETITGSLSKFGASPYRIPDGKMTLLQVFPFTAKELHEHGEDGVGKFKHVDRIGGGIQAGDRKAWSKWSLAYDDKLALMNDMGLFVGKDQTIMAAVALSYPELVHMVPARNDIYDRWFTLLYYLSGPKVSILIPVYNGSEYLLSAVDSVIKQTFGQWEIIIGINGHPEGSEIYHRAINIAETEDPLERIRVIDMPYIRGKSAALNRMTALADPSADWIALLDVDDLWHPEKLNRQFGAIEHNTPRPDVIGTHCKYFGELSGSPNIPTGDITGFDFWSVNPVLNSSCIIRRDLAYWNPENTYGLEDYELWLRLRYGKKRTVFYNLPTHLMYHRIHQTSQFNSGENADRLPKFLTDMRKELNH